MLGESCVGLGDYGSLPQFSSFVPERFLFQVAEPVKLIHIELCFICCDACEEISNGQLLFLYKALTFLLFFLEQPESSHRRKFGACGSVHVYVSRIQTMPTQPQTKI